MAGFVKRFLVALIDIYKKYFSPFMAVQCKFCPTCSEYAKLCIIRFGVIKGGLLSLKRLLKCNPLSKGGYDPVP